MSQQELLKLVITRLEQAGIEYMLTGSLVSSLQGEPRATHDIDVVIAIRTASDDAARVLTAAFPEPQPYLDEDAMREAIAGTGMFNLIDTREGDKVDFWLRRHHRAARRRDRAAGGPLFTHCKASIAGD